MNPFCNVVNHERQQIKKIERKKEDYSHDIFNSWRALLDTTLNHPIFSKNSMYEKLVYNLAKLSQCLLYQGDD